MTSHDGRIALVTGGGAGTGRQICLRLASAGAMVYVNDIDADAAKRVAEEVRSAGGEARTAVADIGDADQIDDLFGEIEAESGVLDILINQAGTVSGIGLGVPAFLPVTDAEGTILERRETLKQATHLTLESWQRMQQVNLHGTVFCTMRAVPLMRRNGWGRIVNMAAGGGGIAGHATPQYGAAKGAVVGFTRAIARSLLADGIVVNVISQGFIDSALFDLIRNMAPAMFDQSWIVEGEGDARTTRPRPLPNGFKMPIERMGRPAEVGDLCVFLTSEANGYLVGQNINLSGGLLIP